MSVGDDRQGGEGWIEPLSSRIPLIFNTPILSLSILEIHIRLV